MFASRFILAGESRGAALREPCRLWSRLRIVQDIAIILILLLLLLFFLERLELLLTLALLLPLLLGGPLRRLVKHRRLVVLLPLAPTLVLPAGCRFRLICPGRARGPPSLHDLAG